MKYFNNIPKENNSSSSNETAQVFDEYFETPITVDSTTLSSITAFFESRGFEKYAAQNVALLIIKQAKLDNFNPNQIIDTLNGLQSIEISALVTEILNKNRFKSSVLGIKQNFLISEEVVRNIVA
jgi:hypothetical protein